MLTKKMLIFVITGVVLTGLIVFYLVTRIPTYDEIIIRIENLQRSANNFSTNYNVYYESFINGTKTNLTGTAHFDFNKSGSLWDNNLSFIEGTIYDIPPFSLVGIMKKSEISGVVDYNSNGIPCLMLNALVSENVTYQLLVPNLVYVRLMACFDKVTGYPLQYTLFVTGATDGVLVSYNSFGFMPKQPKPFNETSDLLIIHTNESE